VQPSWCGPRYAPGGWPPGWNLSFILGIEATLLDLVRIALGADGMLTSQSAADGRVATGASGAGVDVDITIWQKQTWTKDVQGCAQMRGGWRVRTGLGFRAGSGSEKGVTIQRDGADMPEYLATDEHRGYDASVEAGFWRHNSNGFIGAGTTVNTIDLTGGGSIRTYSMYLQVQIAGTGPLKTMNTLFSNYGAIEVRRQQRNWSSLDCSSATDRLACERTRREQVDAWGTAEHDAYDDGARRRAMNKCL
jgi:hypothetical protein